MYEVEPLGYINTCFPEKFGIPRQSLLSPSAKGQLLLLPPYNDSDCVDGLEHVSHLWLTFLFHQHIDQGWKSKVRPPRLGGNKKLGVFTTRSSFRPNHLGLSVVKLDKVDVNNGQVVLYLSGVDLLDGTPVVDIKPYVPYVDCVTDAANAIAGQPPLLLDVTFSAQADSFCEGYSENEKLRQLLTEVLRQDPRPAYQKNDESRTYKMRILDVDVDWRCRMINEECVLEVVSIDYVVSAN